MYRDILTNKWVLGGIGFLIVLSVACVLWYQHDIAPHRKAADDAEKLLRQSQIAKKISDTDSEAEQAADGSVERTTLTTEKPINLTTDGEVEDTPSGDTSTNLTEQVQAKDSTQEVRVSPHGFGPYPKVPEDYPFWVEWRRNPDNPDRTHELLSRVFVKLWTEGEKNFYGGMTYNGKIYPNYDDVVYVNWDEYRDANGKKVRRIGARSWGKGTRAKFTRADLYNPPPGLRVLDFESSGIDPYQYLNLNKK
ncbi:MAG: hypothetical protein OXU23_28165 [Candidatus Poribacteria bacterium]|nr:hypothetical protein [Candidatus Poribacteria bacterium]